MPLQRIQSAQPDERTISQLQDNIQKVLNPIEASPFVGGVLLTGISLAVGSNAVPHTLGRTPRLWVVCDTTAAGTIYRTAWNTSTISLTASAATTVALWVN